MKRHAFVGKAPPSRLSRLARVRAAAFMVRQQRQTNLIGTKDSMLRRLV